MLPVEPFDRLDCHCVASVIKFLRLSVKLVRNYACLDAESQLVENPDYQAIRWLVDHQYLDFVQAGELIESWLKK